MGPEMPPKSRTTDDSAHYLKTRPQILCYMNPFTIFQNMAETAIEFLRLQQAGRPRDGADDGARPPANGANVMCGRKPQKY
jgi:hypothetical protein